MYEEEEEKEEKVYGITKLSEMDDASPFNDTHDTISIRMIVLFIRYQS